MLQRPLQFFVTFALNALNYTVPAAPTRVTAIPGSNNATISWVDPVNNGGQAISSYTVRYGITPASSTTFGCTAVGPTATSCTVPSLTPGQSYTFTVTATNPEGTGPAAYSSPVTPTAGLTAASSNLALFVSGITRKITMINNSGSIIDISTITSTNLPGSTAIVTPTGSDCVAGTTALAAGATCTIQIHPGATVSSGTGPALCTTGIEPTPGASRITINDTVFVDVVVLGYGCIYQGGYIYSINDGTPPTSNIGGAVVTTTDRLSPYTAVKFFNRVKFKNRTAVRKGCLLGYERLLQGPSTLSKLLVSNQM